MNPECVPFHQDMEARTSIDIDGLLDAPYEVQDLDNEEHTQCESMWQTMTQRPARNVSLRSDNAMERREETNFVCGIFRRDKFAICNWSLRMK